MMSIKTKLSAACLLLVLVNVAMGLFSQMSQQRLAGLGVDIYDQAFMAMSYLRSSQNDLSRLRATIDHSPQTSAAVEHLGAASNGDPVAKRVVRDALSDVQVAHDRAMSEEGIKATQNLTDTLTDLELKLRTSDLQSLRAEVESIQEVYDSTVEIYAGDGYLYRRKVQELVDNSFQHTVVAVMTSIILALVIMTILWTSIAPALRFAVAIARSISSGKLDNNIRVSGSNEIAILLRTMSEMQDSLVDKIARIDALATEAQSRAAELTIQNGRFEAALDNMHHGLCMVDADGRLTVANHRFSEMFGTFLPFEGDMTRWSLFPKLDRCFCACATAIEELPDGRIISIACQSVQAGGWVVTFEDVTERHRAEAKLSHMARHDALTRLPNRILFNERVDEAVKRLGRGEGFAVLCLDLDRFKQVNDTLGHLAGDELLRQVANRLDACVRDVDTVCRLGGDEFAILQCGIACGEDVVTLAERVIGAIGQPLELDGRLVAVGISVGMALAPRDGTSAASLVMNADAALYRAKADGRGIWRCFEPEMDEHLQARSALKLDLQRALSEQQFEVYYQPLYDIAENRIGSFEALVRWHHPTRGMVSPAEFIPAAEELGLIVPLGEWVLAEACREACNWPSHVRVAVNVSSAQFQGQRLVSVVRNVLSETNLSSSRLELEITETVLLSDGSTTLEILHDLKRMGVRFAMDDFGTGFSSLNYLLSFPFDKIKIDQSFIRSLNNRSEAATIVRAMIQLGRNLSMRITAEGVETPEQLDQLIDDGCHEIQGYHFSRPVPAEQVESLLLRLNGALA